MCEVEAYLTHKRTRVRRLSESDPKIFTALRQGAWLETTEVQSVHGTLDSVPGCMSGAEALQILQQWRPAVLVSDIEMPGLDGYTLLRQIRALDPDQGGKTPAVALSAYNRPENRVRSLRAGFNFHVSKPVEPNELTAIVASLAGRAG